MPNTKFITEKQFASKMKNAVLWHTWWLCEK